MANTMRNFISGLNTMVAEATGVPKEKKKKKVIIDSSEEGVAKAMTGFFGNRKKEMKKKLNTKKKEKERVDKQIQDLIKRARTLEVTTGTLSRKYAEDIKKKRGAVVDDYRKLITKIKLLDFIEKFEVDSEKRILFTTTPIKIQKKTWKRAKTAGRYQVRIDFKKGNIKKGVRAINLDRYYQGYDHPNIQQSHFCYGNIATDIENEYREQDLYELVIDIVDLLRSPNDKDGFTRWGYFFRSAKKRPKNYSFEKFDRDAEDVKFQITPGASMASGVQYWANISASATDFNFERVYSTMSTHVNSKVDEARTREAITIHLLRLGFIDHRTAQYYTDRILARTRDMAPDSIELRRLDSDSGDAELYYRHRANEPMEAPSDSSVTTADTTEAWMQTEQVDRIHVSANLLRPEGTPPPGNRELAMTKQRLNVERQGLERQLHEKQRQKQSIADGQPTPNPLQIRPPEQIRPADFS